MRLRAAMSPSANVLLPEASSPAAAASAVPTAAVWPMVRPPARGHAASAFAQSLAGLSQQIAVINEALQRQASRIRPAAIVRGVKASEAVWPQHHQAVDEVLRQVHGKASQIREKIDEFNYRIVPALREAADFNEMMKKQNDYEFNVLPSEVYDNAGTIVRKLALAKRYGENVLKRDIRDLERYTDNLLAKSASAPDPGLLAAGLLPGAACFGGARAVGFGGAADKAPRHAVAGVAFL